MIYSGRFAVLGLTLKFLTHFAFIFMSGVWQGTDLSFSITVLFLEVGASQANTSQAFPITRSKRFLLSVCPCWFRRLSHTHFPWTQYTRPVFASNSLIHGVQ